MTLSFHGLTATLCLETIRTNLPMLFVYVSYHNNAIFWFFALFHICLHAFLHFYPSWLLKPFHWVLFNYWLIFHTLSYRSILSLFSECPLSLLVIKEFWLSREGRSPLQPSHAVPDFSLILLPSLGIKVYSTYFPCSTTSPFSLSPPRNHPALSLRSPDYPTQYSSKLKSFIDVLGPSPSLLKGWICKHAVICKLGVVIFFNKTLNIIPGDVKLHLIIDDPSDNLASPFLRFLHSNDWPSDFPQSPTLKMLDLVITNISFHNICVKPCSCSTTA